MKKFICAALVLAASSANALMVSGHQYLEMPEETQLGYVAAVVDNQTEGCLPANATLGHVKKAVDEFIQVQSAQDKFINATFLIKVAFMKVFSCNTYVFSDGEKQKTLNEMSYTEALTRQISSNPNINKQKR